MMCEEYSHRYGTTSAKAIGTEEKMSLKICNICNKHLINAVECPDCADIECSSRGFRSPASAGRTLLITALLGLGTTACGDKEGEDTAISEPSEDPQPAYGVPEIPESEE